MSGRLRSRPRNTAIGRQYDSVTWALLFSFSPLWRYSRETRKTSSPRRFSHTCIGAAYIVRYSVAIEFKGCAPSNGSRFGRELGLIVNGSEVEHDVMVQVVWFAFAGRDAVNVK